MEKINTGLTLGVAWHQISPLESTSMQDARACEMDVSSSVSFQAVATVCCMAFQTHSCRTTA